MQNNSAASSQKQNNNNKGENGVSSRRGKSNSESKAQAARNKHKNSQNKEKHSNPTRTTSRSESNSNLTSNSNPQPQVNGQKEIVNSIVTTELSSNTTTTTTTTTTSGESGLQKSNVSKLKTDQLGQQQTNGKVSKLGQQVRDVKLNGVIVNGELSHAENDVDLQREGGTPASTVSSSEDSSIHQGERLAESSNEEAAILGSSPASTNSSQSLGQQPPPGLHSNTSQIQTQSINHRSIFQSDNNSFFSSNTFQKIPTTLSSSTTPAATTQASNTSVDWTNTGIVPIPDSLPTVYSSEDWQAAFGFQTGVGSSLTVLGSPKTSPSLSPRISFSNEDFIDSEDQIYSSSHFDDNNSHQNNIASTLLANTSASKFTLPDLQHNSLQQRLAMQVL